MVKNVNQLFAKKIFAYENSEGDKGIIVAKSYKEAKKIFYKEYPKRKIVKNDDEYWNNGACLYEMGNVNNNKLYCCFPW